MDHVPFLSAKLPNRSLGVKLIVVGVLAFLMVLPLIFIWSLIDDRTHRATEVEKQISGLTGGPQAFLGPVLAVPYTSLTHLQRGVIILSPERGDIAVTESTEIRHRSLFKVPVYQAFLTFHASFDLPPAAAMPSDAVLDWSRAELLVGASDPRGALADAILNLAGAQQHITPAASLECLPATDQSGNLPLCFFGAAAGSLASPQAKFGVTATLSFSGAQRLVLLPFAKTTTANIHGDWPHPSFDGGFLPIKRTISAQGFDAQWSIPFIARGVHADGDASILAALAKSAPGVSFVELADPYQSVTRASKYALLFVALVFLTYFLFEVSTGKRVHPAQYLLIGMAQMIFFLLLLSIAERIGFDLAFAVAALSTVALISAYAGWVFASRSHGAIAFVAFSCLYALIYLLLRLEDEALLIGALASFAAVAAVMYYTRKLDWYSSLDATGTPV